MWVGTASRLYRGGCGGLLPSSLGFSNGPSVDSNHQFDVWLEDKSAVGSTYQVAGQC